MAYGLKASSYNPLMEDYDTTLHWWIPLLYYSHSIGILGTSHSQSHFDIGQHLLFTGYKNLGAFHIVMQHIKRRGQGLKKCIFPRNKVTFPTISYVFLYVKSQNFPPSCQISHESHYQITLFFPPWEGLRSILKYFIIWCIRTFFSFKMTPHLLK